MIKSLLFLYYIQNSHEKLNDIENSYKKKTHKLSSLVDLKARTFVFLFFLLSLDGELVVHTSEGKDSNNSQIEISIEVQCVDFINNQDFIGESTDKNRDSSNSQIRSNDSCGNDDHILV